MSVVQLAWNTLPAEGCATVITLFASHEAEHKIFTTHHVIASLAEQWV